MKIDDMQKIIDKAKILGASLTVFETCDKKCIIILHKSDTKHIMFIPDDVTCIFTDDETDGENDDEVDEILDRLYNAGVTSLHGELKVVGGRHLKNASYMFCRYEVTSIDFDDFCTDNLEVAKSMFAECKANELNLSKFNTSKVTTMYNMFGGCQAKSIDLSSFDTRHVKNMSFMFRCCQVQSLDLSRFDTYNVTDMSYMFWNCNLESLVLLRFETGKLTDAAKHVASIFKDAKVKKLDLSKFNFYCLRERCPVFLGLEVDFVDVPSYRTFRILKSLTGIKVKEFRAREHKIVNLPKS